MIILYSDLGRGWSPITHMARLAARLFEAELVNVDFRSPGLLKQLTSVLWRKSAHSSESCLLIAPSATYLTAPFLVENWRQRFGYISAWVIDSFWEERIPKFLRHSHLYDHLFVTTQEDVAIWTSRVKASVSCLPWGSDVLHLGGNESERPWDLLRVGRQPGSWEDDEITARSCRSRSMNFHGRPAFVEDATEGQRALMRLYRQSKYLLAFSNIANPPSYTHPNREYLTGRWTDALACGAVVAGIPPKEAAVSDLLWEGALLDFGTTDRERGLDRLAEARERWTPAIARNNYLQALQRLDWRWRFVTIAERMRFTAPVLSGEVAELRASIATCAT